MKNAKVLITVVNVSLDSRKVVQYVQFQTCLDHHITTVAAAAAVQAIITATATAAEVQKASIMWPFSSS